MVDSNTILITRPNHDEPTEYLYTWSKEIIDQAENKGLNVLDLDGNNANREKFESYIKGKDPKLLVLNGHGSQTEICGYNDTIILKKGENEDKTKGRIIYARTCKAGAELGKSCVKNHNSEGFIGYKGGFTLVSSPYFTSRPEEDSLARPVLIASNEIPKSLIKGMELKKSYKKSQNKHTEMMRKVTTDYTLGKYQVLSALYHNRKNQVFFGNPNSSL